MAALRKRTSRSIELITSTYILLPSLCMCVCVSVVAGGLVVALRVAVLDAAASQEQDIWTTRTHAVRTCRKARGKAAKGRKEKRRTRRDGRCRRKRPARTDGGGVE